MIEALLFAASEPLTLRELGGRLPAGSDVGAALPIVERRYEGRGVQLFRAGDAVAFRTAPDLAWLMTRETVETRKLSRAALETLAVIAYHQPASRAEIEEVRGVGVSRGTLDVLLELGWIALGRRREGPGRPVTYVTTREFLDHFGLSSPRDLPGLKELRAAGLLDSRRDAGQPPGDDLFEERADEREQTDRHGDPHGDAEGAEQRD